MSDSTPEYDGIVEAYDRQKRSDRVTMCQYPSLLNALGDLKDKRILALACGGGRPARLFAEKGARGIVGIDISSEQIRLAKEKEAKLRQGIQYHVGDCFDMDFTQFGKFDLVTMIQFLHYADKKEKITKALIEARQVLRAGGYCVGQIGNPDLGTNYDRYRTKVSANSDKEGTPMLIELFDFGGEKFCEFHNYHWLRSTYEQAFRDTGFSFEWMPSLVSEEGMEKYGADFWREQIAMPNCPVFKLIPWSGNESPTCTSTR